MKIIKKGIKGRKWKMPQTCSGWGNGNDGCEALLEVSKKDLVFYRGVPSESFGERSPAVSFQCPICKTITDIGKKDYPKDYKNLPIMPSSWYS